MTIPVVWLSYHADTPARGYWDQALLEALFDRRLWRPVNGHTYAHHEGIASLPPGSGAVVVVPAQHHVNDVERLNVVELAALPWVVLVLAGDECSLFPWRQLRHPNLRLWVMTPRPHEHEGAGRFIGEGWPPGAPETLAWCEDVVSTDAEYGVPQTPAVDWFFAGQVTHDRRRSCVDALRTIPHHHWQLVETSGFTEGMNRAEYLAAMASAKVIPCPSGACTPDSFRLYEALEAGCLPLADATTSDGWPGYWPFLCAGEPPFPVVEDWAQLPGIMAEALAGWPANANRASAWWQQEKRRLAYAMDEDVTALGGRTPRRDDHWAGWRSTAPSDAPADRITVLVSTSPIPAHPSTAIIEETIASIRDQPDLAGAEVIVMVDGVRPEQEHRRAAYDEYVRRLLLLTNRWPNVVPYLAPGHLHQALLTRGALGLVRTACVLFVEHDTPLEGDTPWHALERVIAGGEANVVRLHHESTVLDEHRHLMLDEGPRYVEAVPLMRTAQWSQRPHLALTNFYRQTLLRYFGRDSRTMIEDVMHGVVATTWREQGFPGWEQFRVWLYAPPGNMRRSRDLNGRGTDPKYPMNYAYDGAPPPGAPYPTALRVPEGGTDPYRSPA